MSIQLQLVGVDLQQLKDLFGCKDSKVASNLKKIYNQQHKNDLFFAEDKPQAHSFLEDIIIGKVTPENAEEDELFPWLMKDVILWYNQDVIWTENLNWKEFLNYLSKVMDKVDLSKNTKKYINAFFAGRALFTKHENLPKVKSVHGSFWPYGYLWNSEIKNLINCIKKNKKAFCTDEEWYKLLLKALNKIQKADADLFLNIS